MSSSNNTLTFSDQVGFICIGIFCYAIAYLLYIEFIYKDESTYENFKGSVYGVEQRDIYGDKTNSKKNSVANKYTIVIDKSDPTNAPKSYKNVETYQQSNLYNNPSPSPSESKLSYAMLSGIILSDNKVDLQNNFKSIDENIDKDFDVSCKKNSSLNTQNCDVFMSLNDQKSVLAFLSIPILSIIGSTFILASIPKFYNFMLETTDTNKNGYITPFPI